MLTILLQLLSYLIALAIPYFMLTGRSASQFYYPVYAVPVLLLSYFSGPMSAVGMLILSIVVGTAAVLFSIVDWKSGTPLIFLVQMGWLWLTFWLAGKTIEKKDLEIHRLEEKIEKLEVQSADTSRKRREVEASCDGLKERIFRYHQLSSFTDALAARVTLAEIQKETEDALQKFYWGQGDVFVRIQIFPNSDTPNPNDSLGEWICKHRIPLLIEDCQSDPRCAHLLTEKAGTLVLTPLEKGTEIVGVLKVSSSRYRFWKEEDLRFFSDLTQIISLAVTNALLYEKVESLAIKDSLTGLFVRYRFDERLEEEFFRAKSNLRPLSLILFDIDHFKGVNDRWGHTVGDMVLEAVAKLIQKSTRETDFCARYGGEEIAVLMPLTSGENASLIAERIRAKVFDMQFPYPGLTVALSGGVSTLHPDFAQPQDLILSCDRALYKAKESGRNKVCLA